MKLLIKKKEKEKRDKVMETNEISALIIITIGS